MKTNDGAASSANEIERGGRRREEERRARRGAVKIPAEIIKHGEEKRFGVKTGAPGETEKKESDKGGYKRDLVVDEI